jgi:Skp family chaperone for outer membrane proteins
VASGRAAGLARYCCAARVAGRAARLVALSGAALLSAGLPAVRPAQAQLLAQQSGPGWFVPGQPARPAAPPRPATRAPQVAPAPPPDAPAADTPPPAAQEVPLPPVPDLPPLPRGASPPAAVIGVLGVPEIMRASVAAQAIQKVVGERRQKLAEDAQKEQSVWRDMQQSLAGERAKLSPDQIRARERELQDRITNAQRSFRERNQIVQDAAQFAFAQIERSLIAVIRQVAEAHGMNLVLHRAQVALNVNEFDITDQVATQLNAILPAVAIPPEGMSPAEFVRLHPFPAVAAAPAAPFATPAAATPAPAGAPATGATDPVAPAPGARSAAPKPAP